MFGVADRVRALVDFGELGEPSFVGVGEEGTVVPTPPYARPRVGRSFVAFDCDPDPIPWLARWTEIELALPRAVDA